MQQDTFFSYSFIIAVGLIIVGMSIRFGGEKLVLDMYHNKYNDSPSSIILDSIKYTGATIYVLGWLLITICIYMKHKSCGNRLLRQFLLSSVMVSVVWVVMEYKESNFILHPQLPFISISVLLSALTSLIILKTSLIDVGLITLSSVIIIFSEYFVLPLQRRYDIRDGLGLPLLILGWFIIFYVFNNVKELSNQELEEDDIDREICLMVDAKH